MIINMFPFQERKQETNLLLPEAEGNYTALCNNSFIFCCFTIHISVIGFAVPSKPTYEVCLWPSSRCLVAQLVSSGELFPSKSTPASISRSFWPFQFNWVRIAVQVLWPYPFWQNWSSVWKMSTFSCLSVVYWNLADPGTSTRTSSMYTTRMTTFSLLPVAALLALQVEWCLM